LFCTGPCPCRRRFVDIGRVIFLVETFKCPKPVAEIGKGAYEPIRPFYETSKAAGNDAAVEDRNLADRQR